MLTTRAVHTEANFTEDGGTEGHHHAVDGRQSEPKRAACDDLAKDDEASAERHTHDYMYRVSRQI